MGRRRLVIGLTIPLILTVVYGQALTLAGIQLYQRTFGPLAARVGMTCRFEPSCSLYAEVVIARDGLMRGGWRALGRVARCRPGTPQGTLDRP